MLPKSNINIEGQGCFNKVNNNLPAVYEEILQVFSLLIVFSFSLRIVLATTRKKNNNETKKTILTLN